MSKFKVKDSVIFVHPRLISFFGGVVIAVIESDKRHRNYYKGITYMIETHSKHEVQYVQERFVFKDIEDAKQNVFKALQGIGS